MRVNGAVVRDPERRADPRCDRIELDGVLLQRASAMYIAVNKPRGLVSTTADEHGRDTVYALFRDVPLPWLAPVGRLDKASEGLLLMSNDSAWAARITNPSSHVAKTYRVQVRGRPDEAALRRMREGVMDQGECLHALSVEIIGGGAKNAWLEIRLDEGRNRHIRRMLAACGHVVLRLMRVAIGPVELGDLPKGSWRTLNDAEIAALAGTEHGAMV